MAINPITPEELIKFSPPIPDGSDPLEIAPAAIQTAEAMAESYTRGGHLTPFDEYRPGVRNVILIVAARILANPGQISTTVTAGSTSIRKGVGFQGFTLGELAVLNRYRRRAVGP